MCVLKIFGPLSFKEWAARTGLPVYSVYDTGERVSRTRIAEQNRVSFDVSDREWDDFSGQVSDAVAFLGAHRAELAREMPLHKAELAMLDFPIWSRLDGDIVNQNDHLPAELVRLAGSLGLAIEMSIYARNAFDFAE